MSKHRSDEGKGGEMRGKIARFAPPGMQFPSHLPVSLKAIYNTSTSSFWAEWASEDHPVRKDENDTSLFLWQGLLYTMAD